MELEEISPNDEVTARVIDNYSTGAASRIESGMAAIDEIADGNPEIADMAALMFHVAAYDREQA